eukprot:COSAG01_NODE_55810_length_322_cov_1.488789_1_plen_92_part_10
MVDALLVQLRLKRCHEPVEVLPVDVAFRPPVGLLDHLLCLLGVGALQMEQSGQPLNEVVGGDGPSFVDVKQLERVSGRGRRVSICLDKNRCY